MGPDPGRGMEVFRSSDSELATFCKLWGKRFVIPCSDLPWDISTDFTQQKSDTEFNRMLNQSMGVPYPPHAYIVCLTNVSLFSLDGAII
jgi:hypothetical protein